MLNDFIKQYLVFQGFASNSEVFFIKRTPEATYKILFNDDHEVKTVLLEYCRADNSSSTIVEVPVFSSSHLLRVITQFVNQ